MSTIRQKPAAVVEIDGVTRLTRNAQVTLDDGWAPYVQGEVTLPSLDPADAEAIDPRTAPRCTITASNPSSIGDTSRVFDLGIRARAINHADRSVTLTVASDEALAQDWAPLTVDKTPRTHEASLRALVEYVVERVVTSGITLAPSGDVDMTAYWTLTNYVVNPSVVGSTFGWAASTGASAIDYSTAVGGAGGTASAIRWTASAAEARVSAGQYSARQGVTYTGSAYVRSATTARQMRVRLHFRDSENALLSQPVGASVLDTTTTWGTRVSIIAKAPPGTARVALVVEALGSAVGQFHYADWAMLTESDEVVPYFDGSTASAGYTSSWEDGAHTSQSTRVPTVEREPELYVWPSGVSAWDFLAPILSAAERRLFCDEARVWHIVTSDYAVPGVVSITQGFNALRGVDEITRDDGALWADGVVVRYTWTDRYGIEKVREDSAGSPGKVRTIEYDRPYPGPGAAAYILSRMQGQGRTQDVSALLDYGTTPSQGVSIVLPGTYETSGVLRSVTFDMGTGTMDIGSRGLTELTPEAWLALDAGESWLDSPIGGSWIGEVV